jgi:ArsR family transcriptional regulator
MEQREGLYERQAQLCALLAHPLRLQILDELRRGAACVYHLWQMTGRSQPVISQHLRRLREAGMVVAERRGSRVFYGLAPRPDLDALLNDLLGPQAEDRYIPPQACEGCLPTVEPISETKRR